MEFPINEYYQSYKWKISNIFLRFLNFILMIIIIIIVTHDLKWKEKLDAYKMDWPPVD